MSKLNLRASPTRIQSLEKCSYMYYAGQVLKVPQFADPTRAVGIVVHTALEVMQNKRHMEIFKFVQANKTIFGTPLGQLVINKLKKDNFNQKQILDIVDDCVVTGLGYDFFSKASKMVVEEKFEIKVDDLLVTGVIDKIEFFSKDIRIRDYKTSKQKFNNRDLPDNLQALTYSWAIWKKYNIIPSMEFVFVKYKKSPCQPVPRFTIEDMKGVEEKYRGLIPVLSKFDDKAARSNMAAGNPEVSWLCGRGSWKCPYKDSVSYFAIVDEDGTIFKTGFTKEVLKPKKDQVVIRRIYRGCPAWRNHDELL